MNRLTAIAIVLLAAPLSAETVQITIHGYQSCETGQCVQVTGYASGVTIGQLPDGTDAILTAGHSYRGLSNPQTTVTWFGNQRLPARVVAIGSSVDAAVIATRLPKRPKCLPINESLAAGETVKTQGYALGERPEARTGVWNGSVVSGVYPEQGESGGPVCADGGIAGVIVGYDRDGMIVETCTRIRSWMFSVGCYPVCQPVVIQSPPVRPIQVAPGSLPPVPQPPPAAVAGCDCSANMAELKAMLAAEQKKNQSQAGLIVSLRTDLDSLRTELTELKASKTTVEIYEAGKLVDSDKYPLTGPIKLEFDPQ